MNNSKSCKLECLVFILLLFFVATNGFAQGPERLQRPTSPTAATLGKFGQIEMDYFNGLPSISVPIYTIKSGNISIPISLMYHASGVKPDQKSGWVGLNWSLNLPFSINRILNGEPDERLLSDFQFDAPGAQYPFAHSYYDHFSVLNTNNWYTDQQLNIYIGKRFANEVGIPYDPVAPVPSPDEFVFNFLGYSGSFLLNHLGEWKVKCDAPGGIKVEAVDIFPNVPVTTTHAELAALGYAATITSLHPDNNSTTTKKRMIKGFTLVDGDGNKYVFGSGENALEYSRFPNLWPPEDTWGNLTIPVTYYMTKIIPRKGTEIDFEYTKSDYYQFNNTEVWKTMTTSTTGYVYSTNGPGNNVTTNIVNGSYLNRISFADGYIDFNKSIMNDLENPYNNGGGAYMPYSLFRDIYDQFIPHQILLPKYYKLNSINVYNLNNTLKKKYDLVYNEATNKRLMLSEVKDVSGDLPIKYSFSYFLDPTKPLPVYHARQLDHWGYWNGVNWFQNNSNNLSISNYSSYYNSRQPQLDWAKQGTLEQITFPTGGTTKFIYQLNDYTGLLNYYNGNTSTTFDPNADITYSENTSPTIRPAGGLRIWKIENNFPGLNQAYTREFDYSIPGSTGNPLKSSGVLAGLPNYLEQGQLWGLGGWWNFCTWQNYNTQTLGLTNGSHITYSQVKEILPGGAYVIRKYANNDNPLYRDQKYLDKFIANGNIYKGNIAFSSLALERGLLQEENYYNTSGVIVKALKYTYNISPTKFDDHVRMVDFTVTDVKVDFADIINDPHYNYNFILLVRNAYSYKKYMYPNLPTKIEETTKSVDGLQSLTTITNITYDNQRNLKEKSILGSDNKLIRTFYKYANDYPSTGTDNTSLSITNLKNKNYRNAVIEKIVVKSDANGANAIVEDAELNFYETTEPVFKKQIKLSKNLSIPYSTAFESYIGNDNQFHYNTNYDVSPLYEVNLYNNDGKPLQDKDQQGIVNSYIWDNENQLLATCKAAAFNDIACTSFETSEKGNWTYSGNASSDPTAPTGTLCYNFSNGAITKSGLTSGTYIVSYWSKSGPNTVNGSSTPGFTGRSLNGWTNYEHEITGASVNINGSGLIDEVRLYPKGALMTSFTFEPLIGTKSECDPNNRILYYEYDGFGRLILIRDQDKNITKKICYNYAGQPVNCATGCTGLPTTADWQNTTTPLRCQQGSCGTTGNTGYQEQEQRDMNPCSPTFDDTRWVVVGYNPTACPVPVCVNLTSTNVTGASGYIANYYNANTNVTFVVPATTGLQPLGNLAAGNYKLKISRITGPQMSGFFASGCFKQTVTGQTSALFLDVNVSSTTCNSITVDISGIPAQ